MKTSSKQVIIVRRAGHEPPLWIIDSEQWPRACLRAELIERGYNPYGYITIADALDELAQGRSERPEAIVLELRSQDITRARIDALLKLGIPTILLGGTLELNDPDIQPHSWKVVFKRPFSLGQVADTIQLMVPVKRTA